MLETASLASHDFWGVAATRTCSKWNHADDCASMEAIPVTELSSSKPVWRSQHYSALSSVNKSAVWVNCSGNPTATSFSKHHKQPQQVAGARKKKCLKIIRKSIIHRYSKILNFRYSSQSYVLSADLCNLRHPGDSMDCTHLAVPTSPSLEPLHIIYLIDFDLKGLPQPPLPTPQWPIHPADPGAVGSLPCWGGGVKG